MNWKSTTPSLALAAACLLPGGISVAAESTTELTLGTGYLDDAAVRTTDTQGLDDDGLHVFGGLDFNAQEEDEWYRISLDELGLGNRAIDVEYGEWGIYRLRFNYRELDYRRIHDGEVIFTNPGSHTLLLPTSWVADATTAGMSELEAALRPHAFGHERQRLGIDARRFFSNWTLNLEATHEKRRGTRPQAGMIGNSGGNPRAVFLPMPIHFETREIDASAAYVQSDWQLQLGYRASVFDNSLASTRWQNPFSAIAGWEPEAGYPSGYGELAQEPGNQHHQLYASGAWRPVDRLRLTGDMNLGRMEQDEPFLPYTVNPAIDVNTLLPRDSLEGRIDITRVNLGLRHTTTPRLQLHAGFRFDDRDNRTPQDAFRYVGGDSRDQDPDDSASRARINLPWSFRETRWTAGANWRASSSLRIRSEYRHSNVHRDFSDVAETETDTLSVNASGGINPQWQWQAGVIGERRRGSEYRGELPYLATHTQAYLDTVPEELQFENHPLLRKFHLADRDRRSAQFGLAWNDLQDVSINIMSRYHLDDYDKAYFGLTHSRMRSHTIDAAWYASDAISLNGFASREYYDSEQASRSFRGFALLTDMNDPDRNWNTTLQDRIDTFGVGARGETEEQRWEWSLDYTWSDGDSRVATFTGPALASEQLPDVSSTLQSLSAQLTYRINADWRLHARWQHERAEVRDWAYSNVAAGTLDNVITLGDNAPIYRINWFTVAVSLTL
jgi:MtrB/PioB family decaheme-associated outer membrane protein